MRLTVSCLLISVSFFLLLLPPAPIHSQNQIAPYWLYEASGSLQHVVPADLDEDGIDEFVLVDEQGEVTFVNGKGEREWSQKIGTAVTAVGILPQPIPNTQGQAVVLGMENELALLTNYGDELWRIPITAVDIPLSLLTSTGYAESESWQKQYPAVPAAIQPFDYNQDGQAEILVLLQSGQLKLYDQQGNLLWNYIHNTNPSLDATPLMQIADFDPELPGDEILLGAFTPRRFSQLLLIDNSGTAMWEHNVSGRITGLATTYLDDAPYIVVGTNRGELLMYQPNRDRVWLRTLNKPITTLAQAETPAGPLILAGTEVGMLTAYDTTGSRVWTQELAPDADQIVQNISTASFIPEETQPLFSVLLRSQSQPDQLADVLLVNSDGRILEQFAEADAHGLTQLVDINHDQLSELLLADFASIELQGLGIGSSTFATEWEYPFNSLPTAVLTTDLTQDGIDEILIGTKDGRIHRLSQTGETQWIINPGSPITHMAQVSGENGDPPKIALIRERETTAENKDLPAQSILELRYGNGDKVWEQVLDNQATSLLVTDFIGNSSPDILVGDDQGRIIVYDHKGTVLWDSMQINEPINQILVRTNPDISAKELLLVSNDTIYATNRFNIPIAIATYPGDVQDVYLVNENSTMPLAFIATTNEGEFFTLTDGMGNLLPDYPLPLNGRSLASLHYLGQTDGPNDEQPPTNEFLIATDNDTLLNLRLRNSAPVIEWEIENLADITSIFHGNLDDNTIPEIAVGDKTGNIYLITDPPDISEKLNVVSSIFSLDAVDNINENNSDLLVTADNGRLHLFSAKENRPPLLTNPQVTIEQEISSFSVSVQDVERDDIMVRLEVLHPQTRNWLSQGERQVSGGGNLVWPNLTVPQKEDGSVTYRFFFTDGFHEGHVTPPTGKPIISNPSQPSPFRFITAGLVLAAIGAAIVLIRQRQTSTVQARRFYRALKQNPRATLPLLEEKYQQTQGASNFLVNLANEARLRADMIITNLTDGLFLLADRPNAGLSIMSNALDEVSRLKADWDGLGRWMATCKTGQVMLEAPSITELSLLRPQLAELLTFLRTEGKPALILGELLPILTNLRDSERVDRIDDRLIYLSEANLLTNLLRNELGHYPASIERTMVAALIGRWSGLLSAEIEEIRGQAEPDITLKTKQLLPIGQTDVIIEIANNGRSPAENIMVMLDNNPAYAIHSDPKIISFLPPRRTWQINFTIEPKVSDRFRLALTVTYDDRNKRDRQLFFGDMVHLLLPSQEFQPIPNPYLPGTPLRQDSTLFYGREELFAFIEENAARLSQRNVLILFGQRRTGKTSIMLRLQQHLPENLLPVYIDCQSLGVTQGMPALLSDLAWQIADALMQRDIDIDVPGTAVWQKEPTVLFQRRFLPKVRQLLPKGTTLLLVFDEFEAFESLVRDGLLPPTFFTYIRHLMQHSEGLSFIFVGTRRLEEMTADYWSVLFNIALYEKIGYLDEESIARLIREPVDPYLIYDDLALDKIRRVTAGHPYFLQLVCYTLVKRANAQRSTYVTISDVNAALDEMMLLGEVHFAYIWQRSSFAEKAMLTAVAHLMEVDRLCHPEDLMQYLETYGISLKPTEVTTALNSLTQREILAEVSEGVTTLYELKTGLIGLWVAKYKSLSKLHAERETELA
ncbi:MAG: AAA family ATPase [Anaerolineae bacterium]|nr:AAA family ATPase [Anaerolineae bacterium]